MECFEGEFGQNGLIQMKSRMLSEHGINDLEFDKILEMVNWIFALLKSLK